MKDLTFREASDIAEGLIVYDDPEVIKAAWQFLIDRHHIRRMDEWFQKTAAELIELKICWPAPQRAYIERKRKKTYVQKDNSRKFIKQP